MDQKLNQRSYFKKYHVIVYGNDVKQMESIRDITDWKERKK